MLVACSGTSSGTGGSGGAGGEGAAAGAPNCDDACWGDSHDADCFPTEAPAGMFICENVFCELDTEYCEGTFYETCNTSYSCKPLPSPTTTCADIEEGNSDCVECSVSAEGGLVVACY